jgi:hypothetical protein
MQKLILILIFLVSCGQDNKYYLTSGHPKDGTSCSVERVSGGSKISCTNGSYSYIYDGTSANCSVVGNSTGARISCSDGSVADVDNGATGATGSQGEAGEQGVAGNDGQSCTVENTANGSLLTCGTQTTFIRNGTDGTDGTNGTDATPVTMVQFCKGYQTTYPSTFAEVGICVNGQITAVYWDGHNAWLSSIPTGYYSSTSTSAPCNFTVLPNCQIKN